MIECMSERMFIIQLFPERCFCTERLQFIIFVCARMSVCFVVLFFSFKFIFFSTDFVATPSTFDDMRSGQLRDQTNHELSLAGETELCSRSTPHNSSGHQRAHTVRRISETAVTTSSPRDLAPLCF
jgi:hypothetical protein